MDWYRYGDDVAGRLVRERRSLDILPLKKEAKLSASEVQESWWEAVKRICGVGVY